jgi:hypothetical protein
VFERVILAGKHVTIATLFALAVALAAAAQPPRTALAQAPLPAPPRGAFAGVPPRTATALLVATEPATAAALSATLGDTGCSVESIFLLRPSSGAPTPPAWSGYLEGAPAAVNDAFVARFPSIPAGTPFFVRCRLGNPPVLDVSNATYRVGNQDVTLADGRSEAPAAPGSAIRVTTQLTDRQAYGQLDANVLADAAVVLTHQPGGSGTFYYLAFQSGGTVTAATVLLGDRVSVETVSIAHGRIAVTYLDRGAAEPLTAPPTQPVTKVFTVQGGALVEVGVIRG